MELYLIDANGRVEALNEWPEVSGQLSYLDSPVVADRILTEAGVMHDPRYVTALYDRAEGYIQGPLFTGPITLVMGKYVRIILKTLPIK